MKKQPKILSCLMVLFTFLTSAVYANTLSAKQELIQGGNNDNGNTIDTISSITGPTAISKGKQITVDIDYTTTDKDLLFALMQTSAPWTGYYYQRVHAGEDGSKITFTVPDNISAGTELMYQAYLTPKDKGWGRGKRPVINVSWEDANKYCQWF